MKSSVPIGIYAAFWIAPLLLLGACATARKPSPPVTEPPGSAQPAGPAPSRVLGGRTLHAPPSLASAADVPVFIDWACQSTVDEREDGRKVIASAASNEEVIKAISAEVDRSSTTDHPRALVALAILGEMRSPTGARFLSELAARPLPDRGTVIDGEIIEQTSLAMLQGKAVDGLAYMRDPKWDRRVLEIARQHPSRIVRAEAINAYLWNHGDSEAAKKALRAVVQREDVLFVDRVRHVTGEPAEKFNARLAAYLKSHPETIPPPPEQNTAPPPQPPNVGPAYDAKPPPF